MRISLMNIATRRAPSARSRTARAGSCGRTAMPRASLASAGSCRADRRGHARHRARRQGGGPLAILPRAIQSRERPDLRILRDPFSPKPHVLFYATKRVGGGVSDFQAIKAARLLGLTGRAEIRPPCLTGGRTRPGAPFDPLLARCFPFRSSGRGRLRPVRAEAGPGQDDEDAVMMLIERPPCRARRCRLRSSGTICGWARASARTGCRTRCWKATCARRWRRSEARTGKILCWSAFLLEPDLLARWRRAGPAPWRR